MSRVGKKIIPLPAGVTVKSDGEMVSVKGPKGELSRSVLPHMKIVVDASEIRVELDEANGVSAMHGTMRANLNNMVTGVTQGFTRTLEINGMGYRAAMDGKRKLVLQLGYSHPVHFELPATVDAAVEGNNKIVLSSINKEVLGQAAAEIRGFRPPEPYKGKGIKYDNEHVIRKAGKTAGSS
jgi:large subunit ribosomal protein L6